MALTITGKVVEAEPVLSLANMNGTEIVRIKKFVGGRWVNFQTTFNTLATFIIGTATPITEKIKIASADVPGGVYTNTKLIGLDETTDFCLWTDEGSGTLVDFTDGVNIYNSAAGTFTIPQQKYVLLIFNS